jgi:hypothetical protein
VQERAREREKGEVRERERETAAREGPYPLTRVAAFIRRLDGKVVASDGDGADTEVLIPLEEDDEEVGVGWALDGPRLD